MKVLGTDRIMTQATILALLLAPAQAVPESPPGRDTRAFRAVLRGAGFRPLANFDEAAADPRSHAVIVLGDPTPLDQLEAGGLATLVANGAALLVATDRPTGDELTQMTGYAVDGRLLRGPIRFDQLYRQNFVDCPAVQPQTGFSFIRLPEPTFDGLTDPPVYANRPSFLEAAERGNFRNFPVLAQLPVNSGYSEGGRRWYFNGPVPFAVAGRVRAGRAMLVADHSVFIDSMLLQTDNANLVLAVRVADWLAEGGKRSAVLFIDDGEVITDFDTRLSIPATPPLPPLSALAPIINQTIAGLEREDAFNQMILGMVPHGRILGTAALVTAVLAALMGLVGLMRSQRSEPPPLPKPPVPRGPSSSDIAAAGRELVAAEFARAGTRPGRAMAAVAGSWWQRWSWGREVAAFDRLARGRGAPATDRQLRNLNARLTRLRDAVAAGRVRFDPENSA